MVALGIDVEGNKHVLDFVLGSSENLEVSRDLISRIVKRGFACEHRLYVVLDGSDAFAWCGSKSSSVTAWFSDAWYTRNATSKSNYANAIGASYRGCSDVFATFRAFQLRRKCSVKLKSFFGTDQCGGLQEFTGGG